MIAKLWRRLGRAFAHRPAAIIFTFLGLLIAATFVIGIQTYQHEQEIEQIQSGFCQDNPERCSVLLDALLDNPTAEQRARIRKIVESDK